MAPGENEFDTAAIEDNKIQEGKFGFDVLKVVNF